MARKKNFPTNSLIHFNQMEAFHVSVRGSGRKTHNFCLSRKDFKNALLTCLESLILNLRLVLFVFTNKHPLQLKQLLQCNTFSFFLFFFFSFFLTFSPAHPLLLFCCFPLCFLCFFIHLFTLFTISIFSVYSHQCTFTIPFSWRRIKCSFFSLAPHLHLLPFPRLLIGLCFFIPTVNVWDICSICL